MKFLILFLLSFDLFAGFPRGDTEILFKDKVQFFTVERLILGASSLPTIGLDATQGSLALYQDDLYIKDAGTNTAWSALQRRVGGFCSSGQAIRIINSDGSVTCEASIGGGYTAGAGLQLSTGEFSIDSTYTQRRVSSSCSSGSSIRVINQDGTVTCESFTDTNTTYTAGTGLTLTGTSFSADTTYLQRLVTGTCAAGTYIREINSNGTVVCGTDADTNTTYSAGNGIALTGTTFSVSAGTGLLQEASGLSADTTYLQRRVSASCASGSSIRVINADGTVSCEIDDDTNTTYTAGTGLTLTGTSFSADTSYLQRRVSASCSSGNAIRVINSDGTVTCEALNSGGLGLKVFAYGANGETIAANAGIKFGTGSGSIDVGSLTSNSEYSPDSNGYYKISGAFLQSGSAVTGTVLIYVINISPTGTHMIKRASSTAGGQNIFNAVVNVNNYTNQRIVAVWTASASMVLTSSTTAVSNHWISIERIQ